MRILLLGEYSSLQNNLAVELIKKGHKVILANDGDGFKNLNNDVNLGTQHKNKFLNVLGRIKKEYEFVLNAKGFDIVQIISPLALSRFGPSKYLFNKLKRNNGNLFLLAAGEDSFSWKAFRANKYKYSVHKGILNDSLGKKAIWENTYVESVNQQLVDLSSKIISCATEYHIAYKGLIPNLEYIPFPIIRNKIQTPKLITEKRPLKILHGIQTKRMGFKGNSFFKEAIVLCKKKYDFDFDYTEISDLPYSKYKSFLKETDILLDQVNSYSPAINALEAMSYGKVVFGGCEKEFMELNNVISPPLVNVSPNVELITEELFKILSNMDYFNKVSLNAYNYVLENHDSKKIADQYLKVWQL